MIELQNVSKKYNDKLILNDCNLSFNVGNIYVLKGKSGSGKTTLLNIISGLDTSYDGKLLVNNVYYKKMPTKEQKSYQNNIGYLMQKNLYYRKISILKNLKLVCNDEEKIHKLAKELNIDDILMKKPTMVSGGELQRVSLLRLMIMDVKVLILDEPTSNLDNNNSIYFAEILSKIDLHDKVVIIATHKNIFDKMANQIVNIEYGKLCISDLDTKKNKETFGNSSENKKVKHNVFRLAISNMYKQNFILRLFSIFIIALSLVIFSFCINFQKSYFDKLISEYPYNTIDVNIEDLDNIKKQYKIENEYNIYTYELSFFNCYMLLPYEYSSLKVKDMIFLGDFPKNNDEILVNAELARSYPGVKTDYSGAIGRKIEINNKEYTIVGLVGEAIVDYNSIYSNDYLYSDIPTTEQPKRAAFILYDEIQNFGEKNDTKVIVTIANSSIQKLYEVTDNNKNLFHSSKNYYTNINQISNGIKKVKSPLLASEIMIVVIIIISFFFIFNEVVLEMYYKQKELGFLKLFHFSNNEIKTSVTLSYMLSYLLNIVIAIIIYFVVIGKVNAYFGYTLTLKAIYIFFISLLFLLYSYLLISLSIRKYIKKDTLVLLKSSI